MPSEKSMQAARRVWSTYRDGQLVEAFAAAIDQAVSEKQEALIEAGVVMEDLIRLTEHIVSQTGFAAKLDYHREGLIRLQARSK